MSGFVHHRGALRALAAILLALLLLLAAFHREVPQWRWNGTASVATATVGHAGAKVPCPRPGGVIELRGDSHVIGARMGTADSETPAYGAVIADVLGRGIVVRARANGGATAAEGLARWGRAAPVGGVVLLGYGTNDAAPRGWLGRRTAVPLSEFRDAIEEHVHRVRQGGAVPVLIAPPPAGSQAMAARLQPYREAVRTSGRNMQVSVYDPAEAFATCGQPLLARDGLHMNAAGHACLGRWLARKLCGDGAR